MQFLDEWAQFRFNQISCEIADPLLAVLYVQIGCSSFYKR